MRHTNNHLVTIWGENERSVWLKFEFNELESETVSAAEQANDQVIG